MFKNNFVKLCNFVGEPPTVVCEKIGITRSAFSNWKDDSVPRRATLQKFADYFGITIDELLSDDPVQFLQKEKPADGEIDEAKMREMYAIYSALSPERQRQVDEYLAFMRSQQDDK